MLCYNGGIYYDSHDPECTSIPITSLPTDDDDRSAEPQFSILIFGRNTRANGQLHAKRPFPYQDSNGRFKLPC